MKKTIVKFSIFILSLVCYCNASAEPVARSPEDREATTSTTTTTLPPCSPAGAIIGGGGCCAGLHIISGSCCDASKNFLVSGICSSCRAGEVLCSGSCVSNSCSGGKVWDPTICGCVCSAATPYLYPTNNPTYNNMGWGGTCRRCPETAPWEYNGVCNNCPQATPYVVNGTCSQCPAGQRFETRNGINICKENCVILGFDVTLFDYGGSGSSSHFTSSYANNAKNSCLSSLLYDHYRQYYTNTNVGLNTTTDIIDNGDRWLDDYIIKGVWTLLLQNSGIPTTNYSQNLNLIHNCNSMSIQNPHNADLTFGGGANETQPGCKSGQIVLDSQCKIVNPNDLNSLSGRCGAKWGLGGADNVSFRWNSSTPISLILDDHYNLEENSKIVNFNFTNSENGKTWIWKASSKSPLLVYDPLHQGQIKSDQQLFGKWTFGGRRIASLVNGSVSTESQPWKHGYEALATLDINNDGKLSDEELKPLALWLDQNQDAISQKGEVKSLAEMGIKTIYTKADYYNGLTDSYEAKIGFERLVSGKIQKGKSIDWSTRGSNSGHDLIAKLILDSQLKNLDVKREGQADHFEETVTKETNEKGAFNGIWIWSVAASKSNKTGGNGMMIIFDKNNTKIYGQNMFELPTKIEGNDAKRMINFNSFSGTKDTAQTISFLMENPNGSNIKNTATISKDGKELVGTSVLTQKIGDQQSSISYSWKARKYRFK